MNTTEQALRDYFNEPMPQDKEPKEHISDPELEQALRDYFNEPMPQDNAGSF